MTPPRSRRPRAPSKNDVPRAKPSQGRMQRLTPVQRKRSAASFELRLTVLEKELEEALAALASQRADAEEANELYAQVVSRIGHGDRALGQAKTKLLAAEELANQRERELQELRERHEHELAEQAAEIARLTDALAAALEREPKLRRTDAATKQALEAALAELAQVKEERDQLRAVLGAVESLSSRIGRVSQQALGIAADGAAPQKKPRRNASAPEISLDEPSTR